MKEEKKNKHNNFTIPSESLALIPKCEWIYLLYFTTELSILLAISVTHTTYQMTFGTGFCSKLSADTFLLFLDKRLHFLMHEGNQILWSAAKIESVDSLRNEYQIHWKMRAIETIHWISFVLIHIWQIVFVALFWLMIHLTVFHQCDARSFWSRLIYAYAYLDVSCNSSGQYVTWLNKRIINKKENLVDFDASIVHRRIY